MIESERKVTRIDGNYRNEATYYLEEANYDYIAARNAYDADLKVEIDLAHEFEARKKAGKGKKNIRVIDGNDVYNLPAEQHGFCGSGVGGDGSSRRCTIF